jgi:hypothetical protein
MLSNCSEIENAIRRVPIGPAIRGADVATPARPSGRPDHYPVGVKRSKILIWRRSSGSFRACPKPRDGAPWLLLLFALSNSGHAGPRFREAETPEP